MSASIVLLLAEDETLVALAAQDALEGGGYSVLVAESGSEAMTLVEARFADLAGSLPTSV